MDFAVAYRVCHVRVSIFEHIEVKHVINMMSQCGVTRIHLVFQSMNSEN